MYALAVCRAKQQTHYDRSPHCRTVSLTGVSSFILAELTLFLWSSAILPECYHDTIVPSPAQWYKTPVFAMRNWLF